MHLIDSSIQRAGKSKLVEQILGRAIIGRPVTAAQLSEREEERSKSILAVLLKGASIIHFDNLNTYLESGALASLLPLPSAVAGYWVTPRMSRRPTDSPSSAPATRSA